MNYRRATATYIGDVFLRQLDAYLEHGVRRALGTFVDAEAEAWRIGEEAVASPEEFETAQGIAVDHYVVLHEVRQGLTNLLAAGLYHLFEQQSASLGVRVKQVSVTVPDVRGYPEWPRVDELRLVANVAKHAEGQSAEQLKASRPDLFTSKIEAGMGRPRNPLTVDRPLAGEDLYVTQAQVEEYGAAIRNLWERVAAELAA